ncbi:hypothetical protein MTR_8g040800 [Medicago truncatula]|uniref:Uncharacterized protein n=1 Tax=Medicago truncatula TaxID=3880 RepID=G7LHN3_MEDTR|nr:hypothetical protein MTR_8g040800 [Medicago truncatula]
MDQDQIFNEEILIDLNHSKTGIVATARRILKHIIQPPGKQVMKGEKRKMIKKRFNQKFNIKGENVWLKYEQERPKSMKKRK